MIILLMNTFVPITKRHIYIPYLIDIRWFDMRYNIRNIVLFNDGWGLYCDGHYDNFHTKRINRERDLYCSVIDCAM